MTAVEGLRAYLAASAGVTALLGASRNLFPAEGVQAATGPKLVYERESEIDDYTLTAAGHQPTLKGKIVAYGGKWGPGYTTARQLADAVKVADGGFSGKRLESWVWDGSHKWGGSSGVVVQAFWFTDDQDQRSAPVDAGGRGEQWVELAFTCVYYKA